MTEFTLPEWLSIGTIGTVGTALLSIIFVIIKMSSTIKATKLNGKAQLNLLGTMTDKLTNMRDVADSLTAQAEYLKEVLQNITNTRDSIKSLAMFINECFQNSNMSAEKKAQLKLALNKYFFDDQQALVDKLSSEQIEVETKLAEANDTITELEQEIEQIKMTTKPKESKKKVI